MDNRYKNLLVAVTVPVFGCHIWRDFLKQLALGAECIEPPKQVQKSRFAVRPTTATYTFKFNAYQSSSYNHFIQNLNKIFKTDFLTFKESTEDMFKNNWELYEHLLSNHDWYYAMSDDHGVWSAGERVRKEIDKLKEELSKENLTRANHLYNLFAK